MERMASEKLAELTISSETSQLKSENISNFYTENRKRQKLREAKDLLSNSELSTDQKANQLYQLTCTQAETTKKLEVEAASTRKKITNSQREKEVLINEINSYREIKLKLEKYCRDIKQKNDEITQEFKEIEDSEKKKLEELNEKMNKTLEEIKEKLEENETERNKLMDENKEIIKQMEELREQALSRDQEFQNIIMEKNLEAQLLKVQVDYKSGFEESQMKTQVEMYKNRFGEFQSILEKSSEAYLIADSEIKKIDDKISAEVKENTELRKIKDKLDIEIIQLFTNKKSVGEELKQLKAQHDLIKQECSKLLEAKKKNNK